MLKLETRRQRSWIDYFLVLGEVRVLITSTAVGSEMDKKVKRSMPRLLKAINSKLKLADETIEKQRRMRDVERMTARESRHVPRHVLNRR